MGADLEALLARVRRDAQQLAAIERRVVEWVLRNREVKWEIMPLEEARRLKEAGYEGTQFVGWFGQGHDTTYPDHRPSEAMGGEQGLKDLVTTMHAMGMIASLLQLPSGHLNGAQVAKYQPIKLAAMEAHFETQRGAPLIIGGLPNPDTGEVVGAIGAGAAGLSGGRDEDCAQNAIKSVFGDGNDNTVTITRNAAGSLLVNSGAVPILGGSATVANTAQINVFGQSGNDTITLDETNGALQRAQILGGAGNDTLWGGGGADVFAFAEMGTVNADRLSDFASGSDKLHLDDAAFTASGSMGNFATGVCGRGGFEVITPFSLVRVPATPCNDSPASKR